MKKKVTKKLMKESFKNIISVGYCDAHWLLEGKEPIAYTTGIYGWNADIYMIDFDTIIVTGYRPFGNLKIKDISKLNEKARSILGNYEVEYDKRVKKVNKLLEKAVKNVKEVK